MAGGTNTWARPVGIGLFAFAALAIIGIRVEIGSESGNWLIMTVWAVLGAVALLVGAFLMAVARRS
ncbi:hypothetical protein [Dactylosporangium sp. CA-092794]|uniref:hypothetical protein n=1 Tax=Dactylosporangium sp. CA-092794 TaxID=3239929 RepID=UPI003D9444C4